MTTPPSVGVPLLTPIRPGTSDSDSILKNVTDSYLDKSYTCHKWNVSSVTAINNAKLKSQFWERLEHLKKNRTPKELEEYYCFTVAGPKKGARAKIINNGLTTNKTPYNAFGDSSKGIYVSRHSDTMLKYAEQHNEKTSLWIIIHKVILGRQLAVGHCDNADPTVGYDCHVSAKRPSVKLAMHIQVMYSQVYIYELDGENKPVTHPRQCLPIAVVKFDRVKDEPPQTALVSQPDLKTHPCTAQIQSEPAASSSTNNSLSAVSPRHYSENRTETPPTHDINSSSTTSTTQPRDAASEPLHSIPPALNCNRSIRPRLLSQLLADTEPQSSQGSGRATVQAPSGSPVPPPVTQVVVPVSGTQSAHVSGNSIGCPTVSFSQPQMAPVHPITTQSQPLVQIAYQLQNQLLQASPAIPLIHSSINQPPTPAAQQFIPQILGGPQQQIPIVHQTANQDRVLRIPIPSTLTHTRSQQSPSVLSQRPESNLVNNRNTPLQSPINNTNPVIDLVSETPPCLVAAAQAVMNPGNSRTPISKTAFEKAVKIAENMNVHEGRVNTLVKMLSDLLPKIGQPGVVTEVNKINGYIEGHRNFIEKQMEELSKLNVKVVAGKTKTISSVTHGSVSNSNTVPTNQPSTNQPSTPPLPHTSVMVAIPGASPTLASNTSPQSITSSGSPISTVHIPNPPAPSTLSIPSAMFTLPATQILANVSNVAAPPAAATLGHLSPVVAIPVSPHPAPARHASLPQMMRVRPCSPGVRVIRPARAESFNLGRMGSLGGKPISATGTPISKTRSPQPTINPPISVRGTPITMTRSPQSIINPLISVRGTPISKTHSPQPTINPLISVRGTPISKTCSPQPTINPPISVRGTPITMTRSPQPTINPPISVQGTPISMTCLPQPMINPPISVGGTPISMTRLPQPTVNLGSLGPHSIRIASRDAPSISSAQRDIGPVLSIPDNQKSTSNPNTGPSPPTGIAESTSPIQSRQIFLRVDSSQIGQLDFNVETLEISTRNPHETIEAVKRVIKARPRDTIIPKRIILRKVSEDESPESTSSPVQITPSPSAPSAPANPVEIRPIEIKPIENFDEEENKKTGPKVKEEKTSRNATSWGAPRNAPPIIIDLTIEDGETSVVETVSIEEGIEEGNETHQETLVPEPEPEPQPEVETKTGKQADDQSQKSKKVLHEYVRLAKDGSIEVVQEMVDEKELEKRRSAVQGVPPAYDMDNSLEDLDTHHTIDTAIKTDSDLGTVEEDSSNIALNRDKEIPLGNITEDSEVGHESSVGADEVGDSVTKDDSCTENPNDTVDYSDTCSALSIASQRMSDNFQGGDPASALETEIHVKEEDIVSTTNFNDIEISTTRVSTRENTVEITGSFFPPPDAVVESGELTITSVMSLATGEIFTEKEGNEISSEMLGATTTVDIGSEESRGAVEPSCKDLSQESSLTTPLPRKPSLSGLSPDENAQTDTPISVSDNRSELQNQTSKQKSHKKKKKKKIKDDLPKAKKQTKKGKRVPQPKPDKFVHGKIRAVRIEEMMKKMALQELEAEPSTEPHEEDISFGPDLPNELPVPFHFDDSVTSFPEAGNIHGTYDIDAAVMDPLFQPSVRLQRLSNADIKRHTCSKKKQHCGIEKITFFDTRQPLKSSNTPSSFQSSLLKSFKRTPSFKNFKQRPTARKSITLNSIYKPKLSHPSLSTSSKGGKSLSFTTTTLHGALSSLCPLSEDPPTIPTETAEDSLERSAEQNLSKPTSKPVEPSSSKTTWGKSKVECGKKNSLPQESDVNQSNSDSNSNKVDTYLIPRRGRSLTKAVAAILAEPGSENSLLGLTPPESLDLVEGRKRKLSRENVQKNKDTTEEPSTEPYFDPQLSHSFEKKYEEIDLLNQKIPGILDEGALGKCKQGENDSSADEKKPPKPNENSNSIIDEAIMEALRAKSKVNTNSKNQKKIAAALALLASLNDDGEPEEEPEEEPADSGRETIDAQSPQHLPFLTDADIKPEKQDSEDIKDRRLCVILDDHDYEDDESNDVKSTTEASGVELKEPEEDKQEETNEANDEGVVPPLTNVEGLETLQDERWKILDQLQGLEEPGDPGSDGSGQHACPESEKPAPKSVKNRSRRRLRKKKSVSYTEAEHSNEEDNVCKTRKLEQTTESDKGEGTKTEKESPTSTHTKNGGSCVAIRKKRSKHRAPETSLDGFIVPDDDEIEPKKHHHKKRRRHSKDKRDSSSDSGINQPRQEGSDGKVIKKKTFFTDSETIRKRICGQSESTTKPQTLYDGYKSQGESSDSSKKTDPEKWMNQLRRISSNSQSGDNESSEEVLKLIRDSATAQSDTTIKSDKEAPQENSSASKEGNNKLSKDQGPVPNVENKEDQPKKKKLDWDAYLARKKQLPSTDNLAKDKTPDITSPEAIEAKIEKDIVSSYSIDADELKKILEGVKKAETKANKPIGTKTTPPGFLPGDPRAVTSASAAPPAPVGACHQVPNPAEAAAPASGDHLKRNLSLVKDHRRQLKEKRNAILAHLQASPDDPQIRKNLEDVENSIDGMNIDQEIIQKEIDRIIGGVVVSANKPLPDDLLLKDEIKDGISDWKVPLVLACNMSKSFYDKLATLKTDFIAVTEELRRTSVLDTAKNRKLTMNMSYLQEQRHTELLGACMSDKTVSELSKHLSNKLCRFQNMVKKFDKNFKRQPSQRNSVRIIHIRSRIADLEKHLSVVRKLEVQGQQQPAPPWLQNRRVSVTSVSSEDGPSESGKERIAASMLPVLKPLIGDKSPRGHDKPSRDVVSSSHEHEGKVNQEPTPSQSCEPTSLLTAKTPENVSSGSLAGESKEPISKPCGKNPPGCELQGKEQKKNEARIEARPKRQSSKEEHSSKKNKIKPKITSMRREGSNPSTETTLPSKTTEKEIDISVSKLESPPTGYYQPTPATSTARSKDQAKIAGSKASTKKTKAKVGAPKSGENSKSIRTPTGKPAGSILVGKGRTLSSKMDSISGVEARQLKKGEKKSIQKGTTLFYAVNGVVRRRTIIKRKQGDGAAANKTSTSKVTASNKQLSKATTDKKVSATQAEPPKDTPDGKTLTNLNQPPWLSKKTRALSSWMASSDAEQGGKTEADMSGDKKASALIELVKRDMAAAKSSSSDRNNERHESLPSKDETPPWKTNERGKKWRRKKFRKDKSEKELLGEVKSHSEDPPGEKSVVLNSDGTHQDINNETKKGDLPSASPNSKEEDNVEKNSKQGDPWLEFVQSQTPTKDENRHNYRPYGKYSDSPKKDKDDRSQNPRDRFIKSRRHYDSSKTWSDRRTSPRDYHSTGSSVSRAPWMKRTPSPGSSRRDPHSSHHSCDKRSRSPSESDRSHRPEKWPRSRSRSPGPQHVEEANDSAECQLENAPWARHSGSGRRALDFAENRSRSRSPVNPSDAPSWPNNNANNETRSSSDHDRLPIQTLDSGFRPTHVNQYPGDMDYRGHWDGGSTDNQYNDVDDRRVIRRNDDMCPMANMPAQLGYFEDQIRVLEQGHNIQDLIHRQQEEQQHMIQTQPITSLVGQRSSQGNQQHPGHGVQQNIQPIIPSQAAHNSTNRWT